MATVSSLFPSLNDKLGPYSDSLDIPDVNDGNARRVRALNGAQSKVWKMLVGSGKQQRSNWFSKRATVQFTAGLREKDLPTDFHDILFVESTAIPMKPSGWHKQEWQKARKEDAQADLTSLDTMWWVVGGSTTGVPQLLIGRKPDATLDVVVHYTASLVEWDDVGDSIDHIPEPYRDAMTTYAALLLTASEAQDTPIASFLRELWNEDKAMIAAAAGIRQSAEFLEPIGQDLQE